MHMSKSMHVRIASSPSFHAWTVAMNFVCASDIALRGFLETQRDKVSTLRIPRFSFIVNLIRGAFWIEYMFRMFITLTSPHVMSTPWCALHWPLPVTRRLSYHDILVWTRLIQFDWLCTIIHVHVAFQAISACVLAVSTSAECLIIVMSLDFP